MATVAETMRHCLLNYPLIFPCPKAAAIHWFTVSGNGTEWVNGELVYGWKGERAGYTMKYDDLDDRDRRVKEIWPPDSPLPDWVRLEGDATRMMRKFVEDNIDAICNERVTLRLFDYRPTGYYYTKAISLKYASVLNVPENITKDWATAVLDFSHDWMVALRQEYGVGEVETLPAMVQEVFKQIERVHRIIFPVIYGKDYDTEIAERRALSKKLIEEIANDRAT